MNYFGLMDAVQQKEIKKGLLECVSPSCELDEATYYGRNSELIKCEGYIQTVINIMRKNGQAAWLTGDVMTQFHNIERSFEKLFGFDDVMINDSSMLFLDFSDMNGNAFTICKGKLFKMTRVIAANGETAKVVNIDRSHKGVRIKNGKGWNLRICISHQFFCEYGEDTLTAREILAILLHEVGHNFYGDTGKLIIGEIVDIFSVLCLPDVWMIIKIMMISWGTVRLDLLNMLFDSIDNTPGMRQTSEIIIRAYQTVFGTLGQFLTPIKNFFRIIRMCLALLAGASIHFTKKSIEQLMDPFNWIGGTLDYDKEKYADAFTAAYGYGADLSSALVKLNSESYLFPSGAEYNQFVVFITSLMFSILKAFEIPFFMLDPHPANSARAKNMLTYLEQVETKKMSPKMRAEYLRELKRMQDYRLEAKNYQGFDILKNWNKFLSWLEDIVQLSDIRDLASTLGRWNQKYENLDFD